LLVSHADGPFDKDERQFMTKIFSLLKLKRADYHFYRNGQAVDLMEIKKVLDPVISNIAIKSNKLTAEYYCSNLNLAFFIQTLLFCASTVYLFGFSYLSSIFFGSWSSVLLHFDLPIFIFLSLHWLFFSKIIIDDHKIIYTSHYSKKAIIWKNIVDLEYDSGENINGRKNSPITIKLLDKRGGSISVNSDYSHFDKIERAISFHLSKNANIDYEKKIEADTSWFEKLFN